ncbi:UDP-N-acetylmuramoylalanine--D-glutamate ligase [Pediococcus claussenii]|uniref:UDP-N-acetylmuramoyl-L-alanine--D-glutamate ligase n=1 Tax=Pediococcus claussenii TaxID=187452 RepID=UPI00081AB03B|nr:UDP-N-acetylmuramoyl-L-alanine--D-glutamate ligase [Pediococcus claussenii]ANZ70266.1 UDP-N-acetylmuramoylalanine--D-glutamate ligase [Pediococcus claussenii]
MKTISTYDDKNILVFGLAKSGFSAALLLQKLGANVFVTDGNKEQDPEMLKELDDLNIKYLLGNQDKSMLQTYKIDAIVKNPGVPYSNPVLVAALEDNILVISEPELAYQIMDAELIGITGSNGKTTVTTMINLLLNDGGFTSHLAGNIGIPATRVAQQAAKGEIVTMELSSFMLAGIDKLHPHIAVVNNIFSNHLDWHGTRDNYVRDKMRITENQTSNDFLVMNWDNPEWQELSTKSKAKVIPFSRKGLSHDGSYLENGKIFFKNEFVMDADKIGVPGDQNVENALAAIAVAKIKNVNNEVIKKVLSSFTGVKHRIQFVSKVNNRIFYNDSKATDIEATEVALQAFDSPIILIAGGLDRGDDYSRLASSMRNVKEIIVNGQTSDKMAKMATDAGIKEVKFSDKVADSVLTAFKDSTDGDIILLSPAAASWDQYKNFEVRGDEFIEVVNNLKDKVVD